MNIRKIKDIAKVVLLGALIALVLLAYFTEIDSFQSTIWSLFPPFAAIVMALITKEVYSSLFMGIVMGTLLLTNFKPLQAFEMIFQDGIIRNACDEGNMSLLIWPAFLGVIVIILSKTGAADAFGAWASRRIKTRTGAQLCTIMLGMLIFIDDYFNCLTVGAVMRPITDKHQVSRAKLAYLIDSTAAPICIIAPISSWAAAVNGFIPGEDGFATFVKTIPYNFYALFTIIFVVMIAVTDGDFGPMALHENNARQGDLFTTESSSYKVYSSSYESAIHERTSANVVDLFVPIISTILFCLCGMLYTGGFFGGMGLQEALANCNASYGLLLGAFLGMITTMVYFMMRKQLSFQECMESIPEGLRLMAPGIIILVLAWSLNTFTAKLGALTYVSDAVSRAEIIIPFLPAIIFLVAIGLSFSTGTSWGTFALLIPITVGVLQSYPDMIIISMSACLAGSVCGDHCSPISDTTVMSSSGAQCEHINHVITQLPYAITVAAISSVSFLVAGLTGSWVVSFCIGAALITIIGIVIRILKCVVNVDGSV